MDQYVFLGEHLKYYWQLFFVTSPRHSCMIDKKDPTPDFSKLDMDI